jgi:hypothetical protein
MRKKSLGVVPGLVLNWRYENEQAKNKRARKE